MCALFGVRARHRRVWCGGPQVDIRFLELLYMCIVKGDVPERLDVMLDLYASDGGSSSAPVPDGTGQEDEREISVDQLTTLVGTCSAV